MSCFTVQVLEPSGKIIEVETCAGDTISSIVFENYTSPDISISECVAQLPSDFNDRIFAVVSGDIVASTGINITSSGGKIYLNSILDSDYGIELNYSSGIYTISSTGLQPSGNYSIIGHQHTISDVSGLQISLDSKQPSGSYAQLVHNHVYSDIIDFASGVSGLLPVTNITAGNGIDINNTSGNYTVSVTGTFGLTSEEVDDRVNDLLVAGSYISLNYDDNDNSLTISTSGLQPSGNYSLVGHSHSISDISGLQIALDTKQPSGSYAPLAHNHLTSDITDFNSSVSGLLTPYALLYSPNFSGIPTVPTATSGTNSTQIASTAFVRTEISNLVDAAPSTLDTLNELASALGDDPNFATTVTNLIAGKVNKSGDTMTGTLYAPSGAFSSGLTLNGSTVSVVGHSHISTDITDFNSSVSGLIPVKNILSGSGISISSTSGIYTISTNISGTDLETVQDNFANEFLVEGTGVQLSYNDNANTLTLDNLHTEINELSLEPQGFVNRFDSIISFNDSTRTFTIAPTGSSYDVYIEGIKVTKTTSESIVIGSGTALNYIHFDTDTGSLSVKTTPFNFDTDVPIAFIHWNSSINQSTFFGEERHGIRMDSSTHKWIHNTFGMQYIDGLSIGGYTLLGNGTSNSHAQIDISDGTLYQEDIIINIMDGNNGVEFTQQLYPIAYIPVYYHSGSTGQWVRDVATPYPLKYNSTRALYNLYSGGTWTTPNVTNNRYFAMWIVATNDINDPILAIMGQREDSSLISAENYNTWSDINLTNIPTNELRPLYRLIFLTNDTFTNTPKSSLQSILDLRKSIITSTYGVTQNDHGSLFGLGDDDHFQYVHINEARTISANHTFTNGLTISSGLLSATSGNFTNLSVSGINVSISGHSHSSSDISNFNSSVSGLLPVTDIIGGTNISVVPSGSSFTVSVSGSLGLTTEEVDDRVSNLLVSGSGISLNYDDNLNTLTISTSGLQPSGNYSLNGHTHSASDIISGTLSDNRLSSTVLSSTYLYLWSNFR